MRINIAIATASGRAFYRLISELKMRKVPFIAIIPSEATPLCVRVAITTEHEKNRVQCANILTYNSEDDPSVVVGEALQIVRGKLSYESLIVGVDPGKDFGVAAVGDGVVLETKSFTCEENAAVEVLHLFERFEGCNRIVKVGNGANTYGLKLIRILNERLPSNISIELVEERGTTKGVDTFQDRTSKDTSSAIKISLRKGIKLTRG